MKFFCKDNSKISLDEFLTLTCFLVGFCFFGDPIREFIYRKYDIKPLNEEYEKYLVVERKRSSKPRVTCYPENLVNRQMSCEEEVKAFMKRDDINAFSRFVGGMSTILLYKVTRKMIVKIY
jgi:hypothetical protein